MMRLIEQMAGYAGIEPDALMSGLARRATGRATGDATDHATQSGGNGQPAATQSG